MRHEHIGTRDKTLMLFGGPYSNFHATRALFSHVEARAVAFDHVICTGDVVAYCGAPGKTLSTIRQSECTVVAGNCEIQLAQNALDCGCGFEDGSACDILSAGWYPYASTRVREDDRAWMARLPGIVTFDHQGARYAVLHGGATDVARFIWETSDADVFETEWDVVEAAAGPVDHIIAGHSGIAFVRETRRGMWINAGVIGMPPHNGAQDTQFVLLDKGRPVIEKLTYDVGGAVRDMKDAGLTQGYHTALQSGFWPSEDVLPLDLRRGSCAKG